MKLRTFGTNGKSSFCIILKELKTSEHSSEIQKHLFHIHNIGMSTIE